MGQSVAHILACAVKSVTRGLTSVGKGMGQPVGSVQIPQAGPQLFPQLFIIEITVASVGQSVAHS